MFRIAILVACLMLLVGPAAAQSKATIQKFDDKWAEAFNKGDAAALAAMYTEDAYALPPGTEMMKGRSAIEAFWRQQMQQIGDVKCTALDVKPLGRSAAREIGTCSFKTKAQPQNKGPTASGRRPEIRRRLGEGGQPMEAAAGHLEYQ
jgi:uncharacterized protein (TIGR02246 family)